MASPKLWCCSCFFCFFFLNWFWLDWASPLFHCVIYPTDACHVVKVFFFSFSFPANWELYYYSNCYYRVAQRYICGNIAGARLTHIIAAGAHKTCGNQKLVNKSRKNPKTFQKEKPHIYHIWLFFDLFTDLLFFFFFLFDFREFFEISCATIDGGYFCDCHQFKDGGRFDSNYNNPNFSVLYWVPAPKFCHAKRTNLVDKKKTKQKNKKIWNAWHFLPSVLCVCVFLR